MNLRLDQTVTFTVEWKDSLGNTVAAPAGLGLYDDNPGYVSLEDLGGGTYKVTPHALGGPIGVGLTAPGFNVTDSVTVEGGQATQGTIVWGTPEPA